MVDTEDIEEISHLGPEIEFTERSTENPIPSTPVPVRKEPVVLNDEWRGLADLP